MIPLSSAELIGLSVAAIIVVIANMALVVIRFLSYKRTRRRAFMSATLGFGLIAIGVSIEVAYEIVVTGPYYLLSTEIVRLQAVERFVIAAGLLVLLYSIVRY